MLRKVPSNLDGKPRYNMIKMTYIVGHFRGLKSVANVLRRVWEGAKWPSATNFHKQGQKSSWSYKGR